MSDPSNVPNPIRLLNEWRDTALAVTTAVLAVAGAPIDYLLLALAGRELIRGGMWVLNPPMQIVGAAPPPNSSQVFLSAGSVALALNALSHASSHLLGSPLDANTALSSYNAIAFSGAGSLFVMVSAGGPKAVAKIYKQVWDWPRKSGGSDGPSETGKFKSTLLEIGKSILPVRPRTALQGASFKSALKA